MFSIHMLFNMYFLNMTSMRFYANDLLTDILILVPLIELANSIYVLFTHALQHVLPAFVFYFMSMLQCLYLI